jgi:hypothetical protein
MEADGTWHDEFGFGFIEIGSTIQRIVSPVQDNVRVDLSGYTLVSSFAAAGRVSASGKVNR